MVNQKQCGILWSQSACKILVYMFTNVCHFLLLSLFGLSVLERCIYMHYYITFTGFSMIQTMCLFPVFFFVIEENEDIKNISKKYDSVNY